jgi:hypothetical protein
MRNIAYNIFTNLMQEANMKKLILLACTLLLLGFGSCTSTDSAAFWEGFNEGFNSTYNP